MKVSVVGIGHVGLTTAACLAYVGHEVVGVDDDPERVAVVAAGEVPFHEPGLLDLLREGLSSGRLRASADTADAVRHGEVTFVCVPTPTHPSGEADRTQVERVATAVAKSLAGYTVVTEKSTAPVETAAWIRTTIERLAPPGARFDVACSPEFLREGRAVQDTLEPDRIVVGADSPRALERLREVYRPILDRARCPFVATDLATAELIKHSANAFLATKISFINSIADICERTGADVEVVARAMGMDHRIGADFLKAGIGFGGICLPKDIHAYRHKADQLGVGFAILEAVEDVNRRRIDAFVEKIRGEVGSLRGSRIGVWGLAYKPDTDDLRRAPAIEVIRRLAEAGVSVIAHDPVAMPGAKALLPEVVFAEDPYEAARDADCLAICTEWQAFVVADLERLRGVMRRPVLVDGRNLYRPADMARAGFAYVSIGRPTVRPEVEPGPGGSTQV